MNRSLLSQQRTTEQKTSATTTTVRETRTRGQESRVSQQSFSSQQQSTVTSQRVQGALLQQHQQQQLQHQQQQMITSGGRGADGSPPVFEEIFRNARFAQGGNALFEGRVRGIPVPEVSWTRQGQPLYESNKYRMTYDESTGRITLQINTIGPNDEGEYTCTAINQYGEAICTVYIQPEGETRDWHEQEKSQLLAKQSAPADVRLQRSQGSYMRTQYEKTTTSDGRVEQQSQRKTSSEVAFYSNGNVEEFKVDTFEYRLLREVEFREAVTRRTQVELQAEPEPEPEVSAGPLAPPQVVQKPRNTKLLEGADATFQTKLAGNPKAKITWFRNGVRIRPSPRHEITHSNQMATLKIRMILPEDSGHYTMFAENPKGCIVSTAYLAVEPVGTRDEMEYRSSRSVEQPREPRSMDQAPSAKLLRTSSHTAQEPIMEPIMEPESPGKALAPAFARVPPDQEVGEGKMARFDCRVTGRPYPEVLWYLNGQQLCDDATHKILINESGNHSLMITSTQLSDSGVISCVARNKGGEASFQCRLSVVEKERVLAPKFVERFTTSHVKEGESVFLHARAVGTPVPKLTWQKDGVPITSGDNLIISSDGGYSTLEIPSAHIQDSAWYQCTAQNAAGSTATRARLFVETQKSAAAEPRRLHFPKPTKVIEPEPEPEPEVIYLRHVERSRPQAPRKEEEERSYEPPVFVLHLKDANLSEGQRAYFEAKVNPVGDPTMRVEWFIDGKPLAASSRVTTTYRFGYISLSLIGVIREDTGVYTCRVINEAGYAESTARMVVGPRATIESTSQHPESLEQIQMLEDYSRYQRSTSVEETINQAPVFVKPLRELGNMNEGTYAHFEALIQPVGDSQLRIEWFKDGRSITASSRITTVSNFGYIALNITHLRAEDTGKYTVRISNRLGEATSSASVTVVSRSGVTGDLGIPEQQRYIERIEELEAYQQQLSQRGQPEPIEATTPPVFRSPIKDQQDIREGGFAYFEARLDPVGDPKLRVDWLKDGKPLEASSRITSFFNFGYIALTIKHITVLDRGVYTCVARNALGEATASANLTVISKKDILLDSQHPDGLEKIRYLEDDSRYARTVKEDTTVTIKPRFLGQLKGTSKIVEGQRAHFEARLEPQNDNTLTVEWYFNGKVLMQASRIHIFHDFGYVALDILDVRAEDAGTYSVVARNALGEAQSSATMEVETRSSIDTTSMHRGGYEKIQRMEGSKFEEPQYEIEEISKSRPIFVIPLNDPKPTTEGKNVHLECRLEPMGDPTMRVEWFFNGKPVTVGSRFKTYYDFGFVALDIIGVTTLDSGEYTVRATNHLGTAHTSAAVRIIGRSDILTDAQHEGAWEQIQMLEDSSRYNRRVEEDVSIEQAPAFKRPLQNIETIEGTNIHLECRLIPVGDTSMRVDWLVNGAPIRTGHRFRPAFDFDYVALDILSVYPEDSGVYTCRAYNKLGEAVTSASVKVIAKSELILESQHPAGLQKIQYLEDASRYKRQEDVDETYRIKPRFLTKPKPQEGLREGQNAHFECKLEPVADPNLKVEWFRDGQPITVGHRFRPIHDFGYVALDIIGVIAEDTATYTCRAVNLVGSDETSVNLSCKSVKQIVTEAQHEVGMEKLQYLEDRSRYQRAEEIEEVCTQAPVFTTSLKNMEIKEGQRAHFECRLIPVSDATMKVEWFHNKTPVKSGSRFSETNSFGFVALDILHTYPEDSGVYTCRASNALGESVTSCQLLVQSKMSILSETQHQSALSQIQQLEDESKYKRASFIEESTTQSPVFTQPMKDVQLTENQNAHFEARLIPVGDPKLKVEWYKNGVPLSDASRITTMHDFGFVSLDLKYVYPEDSGTYSCRAINDVGEAVTSATLVVVSKASLITDSQHKEVAQKMQLLESSSRYQRTEIEDVVVTKAPKFVTPLNGPSRLVEGQNTHLECRIEPYPDPTLKVEWFHNGKVLQTGHRFRTVNDFGFASLDILSVYPEDSGEYTIKATNKLGTVTSTLMINVAPKAGLILETQNKAALDKIQYLEDDSRYRRVDEVDSVMSDKPSFGRPLRNLENLVEGQSAHLEATLVPVNDPNMRVEWYHDGRPVTQGHRFRTNYDFGFVSLDILYVYPEDSGTYMCKAINANGEAVTTCSVQVKGQSNLVLDTLDRQRLEKITELESYAPPPKEEVEMKMQRPVFVTPLVSLENLKEGDRAHLECRLEPVNDPNLSVEWYVNGVAIKAGHRFRTTHDFGYVALDILYAYQEDSGTYMCKAINKLGEAVSTCTINVASRHNILLDTQHPDGLEKIRALESQGRPARPEIEDAPTGPPRFVTELQGTTRLAEGQTAHFECRVEPTRDPKLRIEVYHNGKLLQSAARFHVTHDFGYVAVDIKHVYAEDSGTYTVRAVNDFGECVTSINVQVEGKSGIISESQHPGGLDKIRELEDASRYRKEAYIEPKTFQRPVFTAPLQSLDNVTEGGNAHLECRLIPVGDPTLKVDWFRNEQPLEDSSRIQKTHDFGYVALDITHVRAEDEGIYMCRATNSLGEAVTTASVRIRTKASILLDSQHPEGMRKIRELEEGKYSEPTPEQDRVFDKPVFSASLTGPAELIEGQHAHFECRVLPVGDPTLRFEWYVNGVELKLGSRFRVTHDFGFVTLDINDVIPEDSGVYMCKAINKSGEAISTASMKVRPRGSIYGDAMHPQAWEKIQLRETELLRSAPQPEDFGPQEAPRFVKHLVNHDSLVESQNLHLEAQVEPKTDPNLRIEWFRNGVQLMLGSRIQSTFDFGLVSLDITGLRPDDSGIYMCRAVNRLGEAVSTCTIKVNDRGWLLGQSLRPEALSKIEALEAPRGHDIADMDITYESPVFITHLNNVECREGETAHFECRVEPSKDPTMRIEWYLNGKQLPMASRFNAKYDFGYVSLDISHVYAEDSGVYTCRAVNNKGEAVSTGTLRCSSKANIYLDTQHPQGKAGLEKVQEAEEAYYAKYHRQSSVPDASFPKPLFIVPLEEKVSVAEGQQIHLECRVEPKQDPKLRVEWFFNGKLLDHGSRFRMNSDFGFVSLDFSDVYVRDQGVYTCRASNAAGEAFTSTTIYCTGKRGLIEDTQHPKGEAGLEKIQRLEESLLPQEGSLSDEQGHAPVFTSQFQNVTNLLEGDIAHFEATLTPVGDQSMVVEWFYNGQPLKLGHRERTVYAFGMVVLEILGTKMEDSGVYTCRATNKWGSAEISVTLECIDPSSGQKPQFTSQLKSIEGLKDGDSAHFECTLVPVGDPNLKVEWFHNGQPLRHSSRIKTVCDFGFVVMDIAYVQSHDSGEYICKASNKFGEDFTRATIRCFGKGGVYSDSLQPDSLAKIRALEEQELTAAPAAAPVAEAPRFVTPLQNVSRLVEGQSAHFEARLTPVNDPLLTVEWYFNGKKLPSGHRFRTFHDFGIVILDILYCYEEDSGVYECRAVNQIGQDVTRATLTCVSKASLILDTQLPKGLESLQKIQTLEESFSHQRAGQVEDVRRQAPVFTVPLNNVVGLKEGENAHFEGRLTPVDDPKLKVEWFFNGKALKTGSRIRTFCDFGFVVLEISPVYPEDSGEYSCRASNEAGEAVTSAVLKCQGKRNIILDSQLPKGMERTFERIAELEGLGAVPAEQAPEVDTGKAPEFVKAPSNLTLQENASAHFECQVTPVGDPSLRVEWFHNGKAILAGSRVKTINDFGFVILEISGVYQRDAGLYTCKATNKHGEASVTCTLQVKSRQGIVLEPQLPQHFKSGTESIQKLEESLYKRDDVVQAEEEQPNPPRFITEIKDILDLAEGQAAHFDCRVEPVGDASMRIDWFHNGRPLATGSRIHMIDDFGFIVLDIGWTFPRDAGEYTCRATNRWGTATTHAKLVVKGKRDVNVESQLPQGRAAEKLRDLERGTVTEKIEKDLPAEPPRFITQLVSADTEEGENTHFECRVEPKNDPNLRIEWYHNGRPLQTGHRFRTMYELGYISLDILYTYAEDAGEYVCHARNTAGEDTTKAILSCKGGPGIIMQNQMPRGMKKSETFAQMETALRKYTNQIFLTEEDIYDADRKQPPRFVTHIKDQLDLKEMETTKFECQLAPVGDPNMKIEWFFNGKPLPYKTRFTPIYDFGYVAMDFGWVYPEDSGEYVCRATNLYGSDETKAVIKSTGRPGIIYDSQLPKGMQSVEKIREMEAAWQRMPEEAVEGEKQAEAPVFVMKPESAQVSEGEWARFCCRVSGYPRPRVMWILNGHTVINGTRYKLTYDGMWHLDIPKTRQYDDGKLEVIARNSVGESVCTVELKVTPSKNDYRGVLKNSPKPWYDSDLRGYQDERTTELRRKFDERTTVTGSVEAGDLIRRRAVQESETEWQQQLKKKKQEEYYRSLRELEESQVTKEVKLKESSHQFAIPGEKVVQKSMAKGMAQSYQTKLEKDSVETMEGTQTLTRVSGESATAISRKVSEGHRSEVHIDSQRGGVPPDPYESSVHGREVHVATQKQTQKEVKGAMEITRKITATETTEVEHKARTQERVVKGQVAPSKPPFFTKKIQPCRVFEHESARFEVEFDGEPTPTVTWFREDFPIKNSPEFQIHTFGTKSVLIIRQVFMEDSGIFAAVAENRGGAAKCSANLVVEERRQGRGGIVPPSFLTTIQDATVKSGQIVRFDAKLTGTRPMDIYWLKNGRKLSSEIRYKILEEDGVHTLMIIEADADDSGVYECMAINKAGEARCEAQCYVEASPPTSAATSPEVVKGKITAPRISQPIKEQNVMEGQPAVFRCRAVGNPAPQVSWEKGGQQIKPSRYFIMSQEGDTHILRISEAFPEDEGTYKCVASNSAGQAQCTANLKVKVPESVDVPPTLTPLEDITVAEGTPVQFRTVVTGKPTPTVQWLREGALIPPSADFQMMQEGNHAVLLIKTTYPEDSGVFTCRATNPASQTESSAYLTVLSKQ